MSFAIHEHWEEAFGSFCSWYRIRDHFDLINGYPFKSDNFNADGRGKPLVRIRDLLSDDLPTFFDGDDGNDIVVRNGDIVVGMDGDFNSVTWTKGEALLNQRVCALRVRDHSEIDPRILGYQLPISLNIINDLTPWSTVKHLSSLDVLSLRFPHFDLATQKAIANFLDRETARIDLLIEKKERFLSLADERWGSFLDRTIFGGKPDLDTLPEGWCKIRLKFLTDPARPIMYGIVLPGPSMEEGPLIVKGGDVKPGRLHPDRLCRTTRKIEASYKRSRLRTGDLVISIRGGIGDVEIVPPEIEGANLTQDAARIAPRAGLCNAWLRFALLAPTVFFPLEAKAMGAAVKGINIFDLKRVFVPTPPEAEQKKISARLVEQERRLENLKSKVGQHADRLRQYRAALITAAVTGQIDVETYGKQGATDRTLDRIEGEMQT